MAKSTKEDTLDSGADQQAEATPVFELARIDVIVAALWASVNDKDHALIGKIESLLGIK